jgi:formylglycine-generating enzyme required for sulfatase activity
VGTYDSKAPDYLKDWLKQRPPEKRDQPFWWEDRQWNNPLCPVVGVSWFEAEAYGRWLTPQVAEGKWQNLRGDLEVRLPTEEEWERAVRGTDGRKYPWGDRWDRTRLNCADAWAGQDLDDDGWREWVGSEKQEQAATTPVTTYPQGANPAGLWDGAGNVWEWTHSWYLEGESRVLRGGSWSRYRRFARCASRGDPHPDYFFNIYIGFRVVVVPVSPAF